MSLLEVFLTATLRFLGIPSTEVGVHIMTPIVAFVIFMPLLLLAIVAYLEAGRRSFKRSVLSDISSL